MSRMRVISEAYCQLKQDDPNTAITLSALRWMLKSGVIPSVSVGRKSLVNYDLLIEYLQSGTIKSDTVTPESVGGIRKISIN